MNMQNKYKNLLFERFELPPEYKTLANVLFDYAVGLSFELYFKEEKNLSHKQNPLKNEINFEELILNAKGFFSIINYSPPVLINNNKTYTTTIQPKSYQSPHPRFNIVFYLDKYENVHDISWGEYYNKKITIFINVPLFIEEFKQAQMELKQTIEHEIRHFLQHTYSPSDKNIPAFAYGVPKKKLSKLKKYPIYKSKLHRYVGSATQFSLIKPVEFKTYIYKYANLINYFLDLNFNNAYKKEKFKKYFVDNIDDTLPKYELTSITHNVNYGTYGFFKRLEAMRTKLSQLKTQDYERWKRYMLEIYKLLFVYAK